MAGLREAVASLRDPSSIKNAFLASSPYVLRKVFTADRTIRRLIGARDEVVPLIAEQLRADEHLDDITLSAYAFIVENVKAEAAPEVLGARFQASLEEPGPFFIHFAARAIRSGLRLPVKPLEMCYSRAELIETQNMLR